MMTMIDLSLSDEEFESLKEMSTADAAVKICRIYVRQKDSRVIFLNPPNAADLRVKFPKKPEFDIEVKGTRRPDIAWGYLKVSGQPSHDLLINGMPLYRVSSIGSRRVKIFVLRYGKDFEMIPEPRWRICPSRRA